MKIPTTVRDQTYVPAMEGYHGLLPVAELLRFVTVSMRAEPGDAADAQELHQFAQGQFARRHCRPVRTAVDGTIVLAGPCRQSLPTEGSCMPAVIAILFFFTTLKYGRGLDHELARVHRH